MYTVPQAKLLASQLKYKQPQQINVFISIVKAAALKIKKIKIYQNFNFV